MSRKISYREHGTETYMVYKMDEEETIDSIVMGMMDNNKIAGILPFRLYQKDKERYVQYETTHVITMEQYMRQGMEKKRYLEIVNKILQILVDIQEYMIPVNTIALSAKSIFLNYERSQLYLVCIPVKGRTDIELKYGFLEFLSESKVDNMEDMRCISQLITYIHQFDFLDIYNVQHYVQELLKGRNPIWGKIGVTEDEPSEFMSDTPDIMGESEYEREPIRVVDTPGTIEYEIGFNEITEEPVEKESFFKRLFKKKEKSEKKEEKLSRKERKRLKKENKEFGEDEFAIPGEEGKLVTRYNPMENGGGIAEIMEESVNLTGNLIRVRTREAYLVNREENRIGSDSNAVDIWIQDNYQINGLHAIISQKNREFFIEDNLSENKTYLNGKELKPKKKVKIKNGDSVQMADEEFQFRVF